MSINKELNMQLFSRREAQSAHVEYSHEFEYYQNIADGNIEAVKKILADPGNVDIYSDEKYGRLSEDPLQNMRYHFVVSVALITRMCVEKGMERELAYTLSDLYIGKMDKLNSRSFIITLHNKMLMDFTKKMAELPRRRVCSPHVIKAMDYICRRLNERITAEETADILGLNRSYLSSLFKRETGQTLSSFIRQEKIKAAENMLRFSDYSYSDIAEYFGFSSQSHFIQCFRRETGLTPMEYRNVNSRQVFGGGE